MTEIKKRKGYKTVAQQMEADKRYRQKNKESNAYKTARRVAKSFILTKATSADLDDGVKFIDERRQILKDLDEKKA